MWDFKVQTTRENTLKRNVLTRKETSQKRKTYGEIFHNQAFTEVVYST